MPVWSDVIPAEDLASYDAAGYGARQAAGRHPALLVVDVTYNFTGLEGQSLSDSVRAYRTSCGPAAWEAVPVIGRLVETARETETPIVYTRGRAVRKVASLGGWGTKNRRAAEDVARGEQGHTIIEELRPSVDDLVIQKDKPSAFLGTPLVGHLIDLNVDTVVVAGCTTSGCVRATVVDAFSYNFRVMIPEEAVFDRGNMTHKVNLFDMHSKYAEVQSADLTAEYLRGILASRLSS